MPDSVHLTPLPQVMHSDALPTGTRLGEFELMRLLGVGGFGMVYQAYDHSLQRAVAIKEYMPSALAGRASGLAVFIRSSLDGPSYQAGLQSFVAEARLLAQFDHPSLVKVFRFWEANNTAYMVMPLYSGMTLKQARSQMRSPPPERWLRQVLWSVLEALKLLHGQDTVHRDVSPDNIFLQDLGPPVLLDLGAARRAIGGLSNGHTAVLKVNYAPIEQYADARDMPQGAWSDLYSLAAVVHGCLANDLPLPATFRVLRDRMPSMQTVAQQAQAEYGRVYSPAFVAALGRSLAIRPEERPQSVAAFAQSLGLQPPRDMAHFDWRTELGEGWQLSHDEQARQAQPGALDLAELPTQFVYPPRQSVDVLDVPATRAVALPDGVAAVRPRRAKAWALVAALVLAVGLGAGAWWRPRPVVPLAVAPVPAVAPAMLPASSMALPALAWNLAAEPLLPELLPASPASAAAAAPRKRPAPVRSAQARPEPVRPASAPAPASVLVPTQLAAHHRSPPAFGGPAPLCADSNFFTRPMCMYRECQKPEFAELPACVENTQRLQASQQNRR